MQVLESDWLGREIPVSYHSFPMPVDLSFSLSKPQCPHL